MSCLSTLTRTKIHRPYIWELFSHNSRNETTLIPLDAATNPYNNSSTYRTMIWIHNAQQNSCFEHTMEISFTIIKY
jgi:hypothetical protein